MRRFFNTLFFSLVMVGLQAQTVEGVSLPGELIVQLAPGVSPAALQKSWGPGLAHVRTLSSSRHIHLFELTDKAPVSAFHLQRLKNLREVRAAQRNYLLESRSLEPTDPLFPAQWNLELIEVAEVWEYATGGFTDQGDEVVLAVLDSGFDLDHPDLILNLWRNPGEMGGVAGEDDDQNGYADDLQGWNFVNDTPEHNVTEHGTSVLGIAGAKGNNNNGIAGINWDVKLLPLTVKTVAQIVEAYEYVLELRKKYNETKGAEGAFIVATNASLGISNVFCQDVPIWEAVYDELGSEGILSVGATANTNSNVEQTGDLPTTCPSPFLITVTNTDQDDRKIFDAGYGAVSIDMSAPGGFSSGVLTTDDEGGINQSFTGTSAAAPHVAGSIALLYSLPNSPLGELALLDPANTALLMKQAILEGVDPLFDLEGITVTGGRLNVFNSMKRLHELFQEVPFVADPGAFTNEKAILAITPSPALPGQPITVTLGSTDFQPLHLRLANSLGQIVAEWNIAFSPFEMQSLEVSTGNLERGMYFLIIDNGRNPITQKLVVQ